MKMIGVTPSRDGAGRICVHRDYMDALCRAGAVPVLLPLRGEEKLLEEALRRLDGLLLTGGADVEPRRYGEEKLPSCGETAPDRDAMEFFLCRRALERDLPLLGICRGHEVLNCVLGGTLYQDIAAQMGEKVIHPRNDRPREAVHAVRAEAGTLLYRITGLGKMQVNSRHHQGIKALGRGLIAAARAEDGLIEAVEMPGKRFVLGVQWHPESMSDQREEAQKIFDAFAEACL